MAKASTQCSMGNGPPCGQCSCLQQVPCLLRASINSGRKCVLFFFFLFVFSLALFDVNVDVNNLQANLNAFRFSLFSLLRARACTC